MPWKSLQRTIKIKFEYKCFPVWIYGEDNHLIENDLPEYLIGDSEINLLFERLQEKYDALFIDDGSKFEFKGFLDIKEKKEFYDEVITPSNIKDDLNTREVKNWGFARLF